MTTSIRLPADRSPTDPIIPSEADPRTANEYRNLIATSIGFPDRRYTKLNKPVVKRLYLILVEKAPTKQTTMSKMRTEISTKLNFPDESYYTFTKDHLRHITAALREYTYSDVKNIIEEIGVCPVCSRAIAEEDEIKNKGQLDADTTDLCLQTDGTRITVIKHQTY